MSKLKDYCLNITDGEHGTIPEDKSGDYYLLNNNNITETGIIINESDRRISKQNYEKMHKRTQMEKGDVVIATCGTLGKTQVITDEVINYEFSRSVGIYKCDKEKLLPYYLHYAFKNPISQKKIENCAKGAIQKHFYINDMEEFEIEIPDILTQQKIVNVVKSIDDKIQNNNKINAELESMAKTIYDYWFLQFEFPNEDGKPYKSSGGKMVWNEELKREIPEGWSTTTIGDITICHDSERIPLSSKDRVNMVGDIPYYGATDIMGYVDKSIFDGDYVLIAEDGSVMDEEGHPILQRVTGQVWVNNHAHVLEPIKNHSCKLLMMLLKDVYVPMIKTGSIQMKINQENMNGITVPDIPDDLKEKVNLELCTIEKKQLQIIAENQELASLRDFLLPMLMNGQIEFK